MKLSNMFFKSNVALVDVQRVKTVKTHNKALTDLGLPEPPEQQEKDYKVITTEEELLKYLQKCKEKKIFSFDYETGPKHETRKYYEDKINSVKSEIEELEQDLHIRLLASNDDKKLTKKKIESLFNKKIKEKIAEITELEKDFEKTPLCPHKGEVTTMSFTCEEHEARVVYLTHTDGPSNFLPYETRSAAVEKFFNIIEAIFMDEEVAKIAYNMSFETKMSLAKGKYFIGPCIDPFVMVVRVLQIYDKKTRDNIKGPSSGKDLKSVTLQYLGYQMDKFNKVLQETGKKFFNEISTENALGLKYAAEDSDFALQLYNYFNDVAKKTEITVNTDSKGKQDKLYKNYSEWLHAIEMPFSRVIGMMEYHGLQWNNEEAEVKRGFAEQEIERLGNEIKNLGKKYGVEVEPGKTGKTNSVKDLLYKTLGAPKAVFTDKGNVSLDANSILDTAFMVENKLKDLEEEKLLKEEKEHREIQARPGYKYEEDILKLLDYMLDIQKYTTLLSSHIIGREKYLNNVTGRIHGGYTIWTETGRLNSFKPNMQNVPAPHNDKLGIRNFFKAPEGKVMYLIDFSGFELRIMAWKSRDIVMRDIFLTNGDMHKRTASTLTGKPMSEVTKEERTLSKSGNFGITYGGTEHALQKTFKKLGIRKSLPECEKIVHAVKKTYPRIPIYAQDIVNEVRKSGYVETIYGYRRMLPDINSPSRSLRSRAERQAMNTPIQGSAADIMKKSQNKVYDFIAKNRLHGKCDMVAQVHDEIICYLDDDLETIKNFHNTVKAIMEEKPIHNFPVPVVAEASIAYQWGQKVDYDDWLKEREND